MLCCVIVIRNKKSTNWCSWEYANYEQRRRWHDVYVVVHGEMVELGIDDHVHAVMCVSGALSILTRCNT